MNRKNSWNFQIKYKNLYIQTFPPICSKLPRMFKVAPPYGMSLHFTNKLQRQIFRIFFNKNIFGGLFQTFLEIVAICYMHHLKAHLVLFSTLTLCFAHFLT